MVNAARQPCHLAVVGATATAGLRGADPVAAATAAGLSRSSPVLGRRSARWAPLSITTCTNSTPRHWAPCLVGSKKDPGVAFGEELLYPHFSIPEPRFATPEHENIWREKVTASPDRSILSTRRSYFMGQQGQTLIMKNAKFSNNPPTDRWAANCMFSDSQHRGIVPMERGAKPKCKTRVVLGNPPDSWSFQHALGR